jgi:hypothetical protein
MRTNGLWLWTVISGCALAGCAISPTTNDAESVGSVDQTLRNCPDPASCLQGPPRDAGHLPPPQPQPPAPSSAAQHYDYGELAFVVDAAIFSRLGAAPPAGDPPWPFAVPYTPDLPGAPVQVRHVDSNLWSFASFAAGGNTSRCLGQCSDPAIELFNENDGFYEATLRVRPTLRVEIWKADSSPSKVVEFKVILEMTAFAECIGWESNTGKLHALALTDNLWVARDTGILEDIANFFDPGLTDYANARLRQAIMDHAGVGAQSPLPINGGACSTLGVTGDAYTGAIRWDVPPAPGRFYKLGGAARL